MNEEPEKAEVAQKNVYTCQRCGHQIVTIDREPGTTPFMIDCRQEGGGRCRSASMHSSFYKVPQDLEPTHEWRKPTDAERALLPLGYDQHLDQGGLLIYPIKAARPALPPSHMNRKQRRAAAAIARRA